MTGVRLRNGTVETFVKSENELLPRRGFELQSTKPNYPDRAYPNRGANFVPRRGNLMPTPNLFAPVRPCVSPRARPLLSSSLFFFFASRPEHIFYATALGERRPLITFSLRYSALFFGAADECEILLSGTKKMISLADESLRSQVFRIFHYPRKSRTNYAYVILPRGC